VPTLQFSFLGLLTVCAEDQPLPTPPTLKSQSLLAYLVLHRSQALARERLAGMFWGNRPEPKARQSLSTALWHIRRCLPDSTLIRGDAHVVQFDPQADVWIDAEVFEQQAGGTALADLEQAVALYRGDFLEGFYDDWILDERYRLEALFLQTLAHLMRRYEAIGDHEAALASAQRLLRRDPLREEAHRVAMRAYARLRQRNAALEQYRRCREILSKELGVEPMAETTALQQAILAGRFRPKQEPEHVSHLIVPAPVVSPLPQQNPLHLLGRSPLVGREQDMAFLIERWQQAMGGHGGLVFLHGEAGIGKTRLIEELVAHVRPRGGWVIKANCYEYEHTLPYVPLADVLHALLALARPQTLGRLPPWQIAALSRLDASILSSLPGTPPTLPAKSSQVQIFTALNFLLSDLARHNPLLLVLEDLHWADESTLIWLHTLGRRLDESRILVLATYRSQDRAPDHPLAKLTFKLTRNGSAAQLRLSRLSPPALAHWMQGISDTTIEKIHKHTEGNPFFILETQRALLEKHYLHLNEEGWIENNIPQTLPIPDSVRKVIQMRLARLKMQTSNVLKMASVIGQTFDFDVLVKAWGRDEEETLEALDELLGRRWLREGSGSNARDYEFEHHMVREVVYTSLSRPRRRQYHRRVGEALESLAPRLTQIAGELAYHFEQAQENDKALFWLVEAGEQAWKSYAYREALGYFRRAEALLGPERVDALAARALAGLAITHRDVIGEEGMQWHWLERALEIREALGDEQGVAEVCYALAYRPTSFAQARKMVRRGITAVKEKDEGEHLVAYGYGLLARFYEHEGNFSQARLWAQRQLELCRELGLESGMAYAHHRLGSLIMRAGGPLGSAIAHEREVLRLANHLGWIDLAAGSHSIIGNCLIALGRTSEAEVEAQESLRLSTEIDIPWRQCWALHLLAQVASLRGEWQKALHLLDQAEVMKTRQPASYQTIILAKKRAALVARQGNLEKARALLDMALEKSRHEYPRYVHRLELDLVALDVESGRIEVAQQRLERLLTQLEQEEDTYVLGIAARLQGELAALRSDLETAEHFFATSLQQLEPLEQALQAAYTRLAWGQALLPYDRDRAIHLLQQALTTFSAAEAHDAQVVRRLLG